MKALVVVLCVLIGGFCVSLLLLIVDAATATRTERVGIVAQKHYSPEFMQSTVTVSTSVNGDLVTTPVSTVYPASYEIEIDGDCRFSVSPEIFNSLKVGDAIHYRDRKGHFLHSCEWIRQ